MIVREISKSPARYVYMPRLPFGIRGIFVAKDEVEGVVVKLPRVTAGLGGLFGSPCLRSGDSVSDGCVHDKL